MNVGLNSKTVNLGEKIVNILGEGDSLRYEIIQKKGKDVATRTLDYMGNIIKDTVELNGHQVGNKTFNSVKVTEGENITITEKIFNELSEYLGQRITKIKGNKKTVEKMDSKGNGYFKEFESGIARKKGNIKNGWYQSFKDDFARRNYIFYNNKGLPIPTEAFMNFDKSKTVFDNMSLQEMLKFAKDNWKGYFEGIFYPKHSGLENIEIDYSKFNPLEYAQKIDLFK